MPRLKLLEPFMSDINARRGRDFVTTKVDRPEYDMPGADTVDFDLIPPDIILVVQRPDSKMYYAARLDEQRTNVAGHAVWVVWDKVNCLLDPAQVEAIPFWGIPEPRKEQLVGVPIPQDADVVHWAVGSVGESPYMGLTRTQIAHNAGAAEVMKDIFPEG